jgi:hypothetical protein
MAIAELYTGTQTATINTEHVLNSPTPNTTDGIFQLFVDVNAMVAGDTLELRIKEKVVSAGSVRTIFVATLVGAQGADSHGWVSPSMILLHGWDMTLKQTTGTGRAFPWSIRQVA